VPNVETGPEHYRAAQELLRAAQTTERGSATEAGYMAEAQVHATLALAAATALRASSEWGWESTDWAAAAGTLPARDRRSAAAAADQDDGEPGT
jgi:hypothetical protein